MSRATTAALDAALTPSGLTADEFAVYSALNSAATMTPSELARWMPAPPTTVSSYVKRIEARGHVQRVRNPNDARSYVLHLTPAGRRAHRHAITAFVPVLDHVVQALGPREPALRDALTSLRESLDTLPT